MKWKYGLILLAMGIVIMQFWKPTPSQPEKVTMTPQPVQSLSYEYFPAKSQTNTVAILLHGGSWMAGDRTQLDEVATYLATQGVAVINMDYRLAPAFQFDAPLQDIAEMIRQVDADPKMYGVDSEYRLVLLGFSAGGHLAAQFAVSEGGYGVRQVDACISLAGIYDFDRIITNQDGPLLVEAVDQFLGDTPPQQASPRYRVATGEKTSFLLVYGSDDAVVSPQQAESFEAALKEKQVKVEKLIVPGKDHLGIFDSIPQGDIVAQRMMKLIFP